MDESDPFLDDESAATRPPREVEYSTDLARKGMVATGFSLFVSAVIMLGGWHARDIIIDYFYVSYTMTAIFVLALVLLWVRKQDDHTSRGGMLGSLVLLSVVSGLVGVCAERTAPILGLIPALFVETTSLFVTLTGPAPVDVPRTAQSIRELRKGEASFHVIPDNEAASASSRGYVSFVSGCVNGYLAHAFYDINLVMAGVATAIAYLYAARIAHQAALEMAPAGDVHKQPPAIVRTLRLTAARRIILTGTFLMTLYPSETTAGVNKYGLYRLAHTM